MTETVDIGGTLYDTYVTVAQADGYLAADAALAVGWAAHTDDEKKRAIVSATRLLDAQQWQGEPTDLDTPQPLEWPRTGVVDRYGNAVPDDAVPQEISDGCSELAALVADNPSLVAGPSTGSNVAQVGAGPASVRFFRPSAGLPFPDRAFRLVKYLLASAPQLKTSGAESWGNDGENELESDTWDMTHGVG